MKQYIVLYLATLAVMTVVDLTWIGGIARDFYKVRIGELMELHLAPAIVFYLMYVTGILIFANGSTGATWQSAALYGALFGFFAYATYDLTNLATLKDWSLTLCLVDMAWGTFATGFAAAAGKYITSLILRA